MCGCGVPDTDTDNDSTPDCHDDCATDPTKSAPGTCGCGSSDTDADGDSLPDCVDGCPNDPRKSTAGGCGCGQPDDDTDLDGILDCLDNCPTTPNTNQADFDGDSSGDACDLDADGDGVPRDPGSGQPLGPLDCNDTDPNASGSLCGLCILPASAACCLALTRARRRLLNRAGEQRVRRS
jgi:hypothetical protein